VSVQVGLSLILVIGASLLAESLWHLVKNPLGFAPEHALTFSVGLPWDTKEAQEALVAASVNPVEALRE
jgi:hypothetical protein